MQGSRRALSLIILLLAVVVAGLLLAAGHFQKNSNALWKIISEKCLPGMTQKGNPAPCQRVDVAKGYVTLKDLNGPLQYLLMPIEKITGMESPLLLNPNTPNLFADAWGERVLLAQRRGKPIEDSALSLAINSQYGRTQNQLHIHISCLRPDVRQRLDLLAPQLNEQWQSEVLQNHRYQIRTLTATQLAQQSVFIRLATEVPDARSEMGKYGMALAALPDGRLALMAIERNWTRLNSGSAEELQDHRCQILQ
ncbi:CDP-diacylglycerol diphosphatase [Pantoea phytobeneficialis]|uniref:CDP-diacylglycerol pyrophosphatase n=1 Tax=Pantoea phytobeneficialis TaxID=2052056 RepID=A0AAP9H940_9GAMM|nr:CDP-diacylglycerol diphosphatase [Pantoea phytobeneficialis]MDO6408513.1 CDP-diacylglycerol diphosphatase [Pantoea phytobeneficialis]QGR08529.1 CDP-diacylglycerol diphosphatase [Pantoea phytobeneficialis]